MSRKRIAGLEIGVDGNAQFNAALAEINRKLKTLGTELKSTAAEFVGQGETAEALSAKTSVLAQESETLQKKIAMLQAETKRLEDADKSNTAGYDKLIQQLNRAYAAYYKSENKIRENAEAMDLATDATGQLTAEIERQEKELAQLQRAYSNTVLEQRKNSEQAQALAERIRDLSGSLEQNRAKLSDASNALDATGGEAEDLSGVLSGSLQVALGNLATQGFNLLVEGAHAAVSALSDAVTESAAFADEIATLSAQTGLGADALQEFYYMADLVDVPVSTLQSSLTELTRTMDNYRSGNTAATEAFEKLGLAMDTVADPDGQLRNAENVWYVVIDALGQIQSQSERDAIAMAIFGRSAQDLNPIINQGAAGLREYAQEARSMGAVLTDEQVAALGEVDDSFVRLNQQMDIIQRQIAVELAPVVVELAQEFLELVQSVDWQSFGSMLAEELRNIADGVLTLISALQEAVNWWNQLTGASGKYYSSAQRISDMWDGGVTAAAARISTPNYATGAYSATSQAQTDAINRLASAQSQPISVNIKYTGSMAQLGRIMEPVVTVEKGRQGPSLTGR